MFSPKRCLTNTPRRRRQAISKLSSLYPAHLALLLWSSAVFLLSRSSDTPFSAVWCMSNIWLTYEYCFALNVNVKYALYFRTQWMCWQRRSQFEHDHRRRADRAPQNRDWFHARQAAGSRAQIVREAWIGSNRWQDSRASGVLVQVGGKPLDATKPWDRQALPSHPVRNCNWKYTPYQCPNYFDIFRQKWYE